MPDIEAYQRGAIRLNETRPLEPHQNGGGDSDALSHHRDQAVQAKAMNPQHNVAASKSVIIVVDDDPAVCNSLKFSLELEGFRVRLYASGSELLGECDIPCCSCLIVDQTLPGIAGVDLILTLREQSVSAPAILITSHPTAELTRRAAGANVPIVEKPLLSNALMERIRDACAQTGSSNNAHPEDRMPIARLLMIAVLSLTAAAHALAQDSADLKRGHSLLETHCSRCHAIARTGTSPHRDAPPFRTLGQKYPVRWLGEALGEGLSTGHPDMPEFVFEPQEIKAILSYLQSIQVPRPLQRR